LLDILYHDDALIALDKPAGRIVVPGRGSAAHEPTLRAEVADQLGRPVYVVHRLDRGTSGVLLFALTPEAHRGLSMAFERHEVDKRYWGLCRGILLGAGEVDHALVPIRGGKVRPARPGETGGKSSVTGWRALERFGAGATAGAEAAPLFQFTAVELRPRSGRLHQVRAHLALLGHPLAVDPDYGGAERLRVGDLSPGGWEPPRDQIVLTRVALHAARLHLRHPTGGQSIEIVAPLAADLQRVVGLLSG
jgi:tRNA pseudouridine32 synthase / 23S rRNA pseudouridine746 synthase